MILGRKIDESRKPSTSRTYGYWRGSKIDPTIAKVPDWEQMLSAGCATYGLQLAAQAQGFDNVWISGKWVNGTALREAFGCREQDRVIALVMIGTGMEKPNVNAVLSIQKIL